MEHEVHDGCVNDGHGMQVKDKSSFFFLQGDELSRFPKSQGGSSFKTETVQMNGLDLSGTEGFPGMQDY